MAILVDSSFIECTLIHITNKIIAEKSTRYLLLPGFFTLYSFRLILGTFWLLGEALLRTPDVFFFMYVRLRLVSPRWILVYLVRIVNRSRIFQELPSTTVHFSQDVIGMLFRHLSIWRYQHTTSCPQHLLLDGKKKCPFCLWSEKIQNASALRLLWVLQFSQGKFNYGHLCASWPSKEGIEKNRKVMELRPTKHIRKVSPFA